MTINQETEYLNWLEETNIPRFLMKENEEERKQRKEAERRAEEAEKRLEELLGQKR